MARIEDRVETVENAIIRLSDEMRSFKDEMRLFKDEMGFFKDEMRGFKDEMRTDRREINKQWGALSNKLGTIVEDLIAPAVRPAVKTYFGVEPFFFGHTLRKRKDGQDYQLDVLAVSDTMVFIVEAKASPRAEHVDQTLEKASHFSEYYPEYSEKEVIVILAGITLPEEVIKYASRRNVYVLAYREWDYMDILNFKEISR